MAFFEDMVRVKEELESMGHSVQIPPTEVKDDNGNMISVQKYYELRKSETDDASWIWDRKKEAIQAHFDKVAWGDAILVLNYDKRGITGYVGANTFLEMGIALHLGKKIYLLNGIPQVDSKEEILGMKPVVINGNLGQIR